MQHIERGTPLIILSGEVGCGKTALAQVIGTPLAKKLNQDDNIVYSLHGDGELDEGQNWEAIMFAAHKKVDNLISTIDYNGQQIDGTTDKVMALGNLQAKFVAFGWEVMDMDGNDMDSVIAGLEKAKTLAELAGAASLAAAIKLKEELAGKKVALILSGGNISPDELVACLTQN